MDRKRAQSDVGDKTRDVAAATTFSVLENSTDAPVMLVQRGLFHSMFCAVEFSAADQTIRLVDCRISGRFVRQQPDGTQVVHGVCHRGPLAQVSRIDYDERAGTLTVKARDDLRVQSADGTSCLGDTNAVRGVSFRPAAMHVHAERDFLFNGCWRVAGQFSLQQLVEQTRVDNCDQLAPVKLLHSAGAVGLPTALAVLIVRYAHDCEPRCQPRASLHFPDTILTRFPAHAHVCLRSIRVHGAAHVHVADATHLAPDRLEIVAGGCGQVEMHGCQCTLTDVRVRLRGRARFHGGDSSLWSNIHLHLQDFADAEHLASVLERFTAVVGDFARLRYDARCLSEPPRVMELGAGRVTALNSEEAERDPPDKPQLE